MSKSAVSAVVLNPDVDRLCLSHALSTDMEEVMGILIGKFDDGVCYVYSALVLQRLDKRKDRVEIDPTQLSLAFPAIDQVAEQEDDKGVRVVGWYHSHPHITVFPSHVDVQTQGQYQLNMDPMFVGLIFGVFDESSSGLYQEKKIAFQSVLGTSRYDLIPIYVVPMVSPKPTFSLIGMSNLVKLVESLHAEEGMAYAKAVDYSPTDLLTNVHNGAIYSKNLVKLLEMFGQSLFQSLKCEQHGCL